jgi:superfamily II DNA helicase RecQ
LYIGEGNIQPTINQTGKIREGQFRFCGEKGDTVSIRTVIHLDVPYSPEAYLQETGRAGRDGSPVQATLLYSQEDLGFAGLLGRDRGADDCAETATPAADEGPVFDPLAADRYAQMLGYALDTTRCRRERLLGFLGREPGSCSGCDVCAGAPLGRPEGEAEILEFVAGNRRRFTRLQAVKLLRGGKSYEVVSGSLAACPDFGALSGWQEEEIEEALEALRRSAKIKVLKRGFWKERITAASPPAS